MMARNFLLFLCVTNEPLTVPVLNNYLNPDPERLRQDEAYRRKVFEALQKQFCDYIYRYCSYRFGETEYADDLVQEVFQVVLTDLHKFKGDGTTKAWIKGIARNKCKNLIRNRSRRRVLMERFQEEIGHRLHPGTERSTEDEEDKTGDRLTECLKRLKDYDRLLVKWRYFDGKSNEDIAAMTDKSSAAVRRHISRILRRLRDCLR